MQDDPNQPQHSSEQPISIQDEMRTSYLDYAMSVIIGRAIPDVRDGLKPVHRRILYAMRDLNLSPGGSYSKCAKVVGQVLGNYHPHGDAAVYDALVRMAQDFSMRHMLIDGQGNFGSIDGDPAAAYRYTECRLARISTELLTDIEKETVDFSPNFDESTEEPDVLPARFPNLLVNGSGGIAVGMATNIPPHNLSEVIDATIHLIGNRDCTVADLMKFVQGPDFPTAGMIYGRSGIAQAYLTGRGSIIMRARTEVEKVTGSADREQIVVTEIPYQVNKARLHAKIGELMRDKRIEGIREARDESDRDGMRLVLELKKDVFPTVVLNQLYRMTDLQASFGIINLSIVDSRPAVLDLKETLRLFVEHRRDVVSRRTRFELAKAEGQRDIVEGLGMAITEVDLVIKTIRESRDPEVALKALMALPLRGLEEFVKRAGRPEAEIEAAKARGEYRLSERQAKAILEMRLARLTGLEQEKLAAEYGELSEEIARLKLILADETVLMALIVSELEEVKAKHGEKRRTEIVDNEAEIQVEDLIQEEEMVVTISHAGYIKRTPVSTYRAQKRGGKGTQGMEQRDDEDFVTQLFIGSTHSFVFFFSTSGKVFVKKVYEIPQAARNAKGRAIVNFLELGPDEKVATIAQVKAIEAGWYVTTVTKGGQIKKTELIEYENYRDKGIIGVKVVEGDSLLSAIVTDGKAEFLIATKTGQSIRFDEQQVRPMGRAAAGVKAIDLADGDEVVGLARTEPERQFVLAVCERGYGKRTVLDEFRQQNRGGKGIILIECSDRNGPVVGIAMVKPEDEVMLITDKGQTIRTPVEGIRETGRNTQGVKLMSIADDERVVAIEPIGEGAATGLDEEGTGQTEPPPADGAGEAGASEAGASAAPPAADGSEGSDGGQES
ncbi:MAG TPA: DNA gyrase subunit A [Polyangiaceae bacterium]|nr:DNA gyrase subunit A [Polyangiaceae bacterium]